MMITRQLTDFTQVELLYNARLKKDFSRDERRPLAAIRRAWKKSAYECYGLFDGTEIMGYAFFVRRERDYLLDYLAVTEDHRDQGFGSLFLQHLAERLQGADCVVVEVENPDRVEDEETRSVRRRRLQFYLRNGYRKSALTSTVFGVDYLILEVPTAMEHTTEELRTVYTELYRITLPEPFMHTQFHTH